MYQYMLPCGSGLVVEYCRRCLYTYDVKCRLATVCVCVHCFFFFFQAEDGIRDLIVTGVQTCALPILITRSPITRRSAPRAIRSCTSSSTGTPTIPRTGGFPTPPARSP